MPVPDPGPFVDVHCHLLPGIDDGAADWEESLAMAELAVAEGISTVVATPHQLGNYGRNRGATVRARTAELQEVLTRRGIALTVLPGADVRIEPDLVAKIRSGDVLTLADRGRYVLLELPHEVYFPLDRLLSALEAAGLVGILSHPERNQGILARRAVLGPLVDAGCLLQVTAGSLLGTFGPHVKAFSEWLLGQGLVHFLATDAHGAKSRRPLMRRAFDRATELAGDRAAREMCCENPAAVVHDHPILPGIRKPRGLRLGGWLRRRKVG